MEVQKLTLKNFKSFGNSVIHAGNDIPRLGKMNMLFGYNNSGKSNLLKFIQLLFQSKIRREALLVDGEKMEKIESGIFWKGPISNSPFIFHKNNRELPIEFDAYIKIGHDELKATGYSHYKQLSKSYFNGHDYITLYLKGEIRKIDDFETAEIALIQSKLNSKVIYSLDSKGRPLYFQDGITGRDNLLKSDGIAFENLLSMFNDCTLFLDNNRYLSDEPLIQASVDLTPRNYKNWLYQQYINPKTNKAFEELSVFIEKHKILPQPTDEGIFKNVESISPFTKFKPEFAIINGNIEVMFKVGKDRFPLSSFGTGIQQILYILTTLFVTKAKIVLIEELELNLSPRYQKALFKILWALHKEGKIDQVFFTTHSKYFQFRNDFSVYEVSIDDSGKSKASKVDSETKREFTRFFAPKLE